jgi:hypothetical protein
MAQFENIHGLKFSANNTAAVEAFDQAVRQYLALSTGAGAALKTLMEADPGMPMAQCLRGYFFMLMGVRSLIGKARQGAQALVDRPGDLNARERLHAAALLAWSGDSLPTATAAWDAIAAKYPRDIVAIKMANFGHFYQGNSRAVRDSIARVLDFWNESDDAYSYLLSMYAFGLEECGDPLQAEAIGRDALARQPCDPWGVHAVTHALEATGRAAEGVAWIESMKDSLQNSNNFRYHLAWHKALFRFEYGDYEGAMADYDGVVFTDAATEYLDVCNDASLLLRLELAGADIGDRWRAVAAKAAPRTDERVLAFADTHYVLALASSPDDAHRDLARRMVALMAEYADSEVGNALSYRAAGWPAARAILAFRDGHFAQASRSLEEAAPGLYLMGGSHAQRDLFSELRSDMLYRSAPGGMDTVAHLAARSRARPTDSRNWALYIDALTRFGATGAAAMAQRRYAELSF